MQPMSASLIWASTQRLIQHWQQPLQVGPRRHFRHDAAEASVQIGLRGDHAGADAQLLREHGHGGFITGSFDAEKVHVVVVPSRS